jgi:hypothetical protein
LIEALTNLRSFDQAIDVCGASIRQNPGSDKVKHFKQVKTDLEEKSQGATDQEE